MKVITYLSNGKVTNLSVDDLKKMQCDLTAVKNNPPIEDKKAVAKNVGFGGATMQQAAAGTPTGGTMNEPTKPPIKNTGGLTREDLVKPKEWKRRREMLRERAKSLKRASEGKAGTSDPRQKYDKTIKPTGHALGG